MARFSLAALAALDRSAVSRLWMTTRDAARMARVSREAVRLWAHERVLRGERTVSGQWLFRQSDVLELVAARARASVRSRAAVWRAAHLRLVHAAHEPQQLALFTARGGVAPAAERGAAGRKRTWHSPSETPAFSRESRPRLISAVTAPGEGRKRMAKVEEPHGRDARRAAGSRR